MKEVFCLFRAAVLVAALSFVTHVHAVSSGSFTAEEIVHRAVERAKTSALDQDSYAFTKMTVHEERDANGQLKERKEGAAEFVARNGVHIRQTAPVTVDNEDAVLTKMDNGKPGKRKDYLEMLTPDLVQKYVFSMVERTTANGRRVYAIAFRPKAQKLPAQDLKERIMNNAMGMLFIDEAEFELVRAEVKMNSELAVGGFLGALKRAAFSVERVRLESGVWFERFYKTEYEARKLTQTKLISTSAECRDFRKIDR